MQEAPTMDSRGRQASRRRPAFSLALDLLECRQLLSTAAESVVAVAVDRVAEVAALLPAPLDAGPAPTSPIQPSVLAKYVEVAVWSELATGSMPAPPATALASTTTAPPAVVQVRASAVAEHDLTTGYVPAIETGAWPKPAGGYADRAVTGSFMPHPDTAPDSEAVFGPKPLLPGQMAAFLYEVLISGDPPSGMVLGRSTGGSPSETDDIIGAGVAPSHGEDPATIHDPKDTSTQNDAEGHAVEVIPTPIRLAFKGGLPARPVNADTPTGTSVVAGGLAAKDSDATVLDLADTAGTATDGGTGPAPDVPGSVGKGDLIGVPPLDAAIVSPRCADLLTEFLPFDRRSLVDAVDRFLEPLKDIGSELVRWESPTGLAAAALVVVVGAVAWDAARRNARADAAGRDEREDDLALLPGDPSEWSLEG
jgi:hypothetical protein